MKRYVCLILFFGLVAPRTAHAQVDALIDFAIELASSGMERNVNGTPADDYYLLSPEWQDQVKQDQAQRDAQAAQAAAEAKALSDQIDAMVKRDHEIYLADMAEIQDIKNSLNAQAEAEAQADAVQANAEAEAQAKADQAEAEAQADAVQANAEAEAQAQADDSDSYDWYGDSGDNWES